MKENKENKENKSQAIIEIMDSGQMKITGNFIIKDMKRDTEDAPGEIVLCLCRKSRNLPYCDESHKK